MPQLKRTVHFMKLLIYAVGIIFGAGIYALIGKAAGETGPSLWLSFLFAAVIASFTGLSYAELSSINPTTAAEYNYVKEGFKSRKIAFIISWMINAVDITSISTVALGFAGYFVALFLPNSLNTVIMGVSEIVITPTVLAAMVLIVLLCIVNYRGIKESTSLNVLFTVIEAGGLLLVIAVGTLHVTQGGTVPDLLEMPHGLSGVFGAIALIFFAYLGFENLANLGEEVVDPRKNIPRAIIYSLIITTVIYVLVAISAVAVVPWQRLGESPEPLAEVARVALGTDARIVLSFIALFATSNTVLIMITAASRFMYGMAKDNSLPRYLGKINKKYQTPHNALIVVALLGIGFSLLKDIETLAELTTIGIFIVFGMINASLIAMRFGSVLPENRFKTPLNIGRLPVLAVCGLGSCIVMVGTYFITDTPSGMSIDLINPVSIFVALEILTGFIAYYWLKHRNTIL
jgi:APA family basic amino acid/polyamine antiporter